MWTEVSLEELAAVLALAHGAGCLLATLASGVFHVTNSNMLLFIFKNKEKVRCILRFTFYSVGLTILC